MNKYIFYIINLNMYKFLKNKFYFLAYIFKY